MSSPLPYQVVPHPNGTYAVVGPDGGIRGRYADRAKAEVLADSLNASVGTSAPPASPAPPPPRTAPIPINLPSGPARSNAFIIRPDGTGFRTTDSKGRPDAFFFSEERARAHADAERRKFSGTPEDAPQARPSAGTTPDPTPATTPAPGRRTFLPIGAFSAKGFAASRIGMPGPGSSFQGAASTFSAARASAIAGAGSGQGPAASASPSTGRPSGTGPDRSPFAAAFERAFDASIGKAIAGAEKIVTGSLDAFKVGFAAVKTTVVSPGHAAMGFTSAANKAAFGASVVAAFAAARSKGLLNAGAAGFAGVTSTAFRNAAGFSGARKGVRSSGRASRVGMAAAARAARQTPAARAYRLARRSGAGQAKARGLAASASRAAMFAGVKGVAGEASMGFAALTAIPRLARALAEAQLDRNRPLAPYSGKLSMGFAQLEYNDELRKMRLARSAEGSGLTLAGEVDQLREGQLGFDKLRISIGNRAGILAAGLVNPAIKELGAIAEGMAGKIEKNDPLGDRWKKFAEAPHNVATWWTSLAAALPTMGFGGGVAFADEAVKNLERERLAEANRLRFASDPWANHMRDAMRIPVGRPARPVKP